MRVGLTLGGVVVAAVVIFSLGVMEGARVAERVPMAADPPSALPTETFKPLPATPTTTAAPIPPDQLTFYDRLSGVAPAAPLALPEGQAPPQGLKSGPDAAQGTPIRQPETPFPAVTAGAAPRKAAVPVAAAEAETVVPSKADPVAQIRKLSGKGRFTVQMAAVSERSAAAETAALIKRNGFEATTVMASVNGKVWYRIRVGSFPDKQAATQAAAIFRSTFGLNAIPVGN